MCISGNAIVAKFSPGILTAMTAWSFAYVLLLAGAGLWDAAAGAAEIWTLAFNDEPLITDENYDEQHNHMSKWFY